MAKRRPADRGARGKKGGGQGSRPQARSVAALPEFPAELLEQRFPGGFTLRDEANAIVAWAFRNGPLEELHAGAPSALLEDDSLSRITDAEMKALMLHACERVEDLLRLKESDPERYGALIRGYNILYCGRWER